MPVSYMLADAVKAIFGTKNPWPLAGKILKYFDNETEALFYLARLNFRATFESTINYVGNTPSYGKVEKLEPLRTHNDKIKFLEWMRQNKQLTPTPLSQGGDDLPWGKDAEWYYRKICPKGKAAGTGLQRVDDVLSEIYRRKGEMER